MKTNLYLATLLPIFFYSYLLQAQWQQHGNLPIGEHLLYDEISPGWSHHVPSFSINGKGYIIDWSEATNNNGTFSYDPVTDTWERLENVDFPVGRQTLSYAIAYKGFGYLTYAENGNPNQQLWRFDPENPAWVEMAECPCEGRGHPAFAAANGRIYLGLGERGQNLRDWWSYEISSDTWRQEEFFPSFERHHPYHFSIGDEVYVGMGHGASIYNDFYRFNTNDGQWTTISSLPAEGRVAGTEFSYEGKGYVLSGQGEDHEDLDEGEFWEYDPISDSWKQLISHPGTGRWAPGSFVIDGEVFFFGGTFDSGNEVEIVLGNGDTITIPIHYTSEVWSYDLKDDITNTPEIDRPSIEFYPNPASNNLSIRSPDMINEILVSSLNGQRVISIRDIHLFDYNLNISHLIPGPYFLRIKTEYGKIETRLMVNK